MRDVSERLAASISAMGERYPSLSLTVNTEGEHQIATWEGWLQPVRTTKELDIILDDLHENVRVAINEDAEIKHDPNCRRHHKRPSLLRHVKRADRSFLVRIEYEGGQVHPRAYLLDPEVTPATRKHIFGTNGICAYPPWKDVWHWDANTAADFTDHVLIWLLKWNIWVETKIWLGPEMDHEPVLLFATIGSTQQCWCRSGKSYGQCHQQRDRPKAEEEVKAMLQKRSRLFQKLRVDLLTLKHVANMLGRR